MRPIALAASLLSLATTAHAQVLFTDDFSGPMSWGKFEERVNSCTSPSSIATVDGVDGALRVFANSAGVQNASHVIAQKQLLSAGPTGKWSYQSRVYVNAATLPYTQTGPELSLQNTRPIGVDDAGSMWRTQTAGIQYVGSQWNIGTPWRIWTRAAAGAVPQSDVAGWLPLDFSPRLTRDGWYTLTLEVDYDTLRYLSLEVRHEREAVGQVITLTQKIAREVKFSEGALWATLEAETLYDCAPEATSTGSAWQNDLRYDDVRVEQRSGRVPSAPTAQNAWVTVLATESRAFALNQLATDADQDLDPATVRVLQAPVRGSAAVDASGQLTYTAREPGGDSLKYRVCDRTFICTEAWITIASPNRAPVASAGVVYATVRSGGVLRLPFPITDPDGNLATREIDLRPTVGEASAPGTTLQYSPGQISAQQVSFHVKGCDASPWNWCAGTWVVVNVVNAAAL